jgi:large subunit ribosomal protein L7/L12
MPLAASTDGSLLFQRHGCLPTISCFPTHLRRTFASYSYQATTTKTSSAISVRGFHCSPQLFLAEKDETTTTDAVSAEAPADVSTTTASIASPLEGDNQPLATETHIEYSTPELTKDAALHKAGLTDPERPSYQNPLHHIKNQMDPPKVFREDFDSDEAFEDAQQPAPPLGDAVPAYILEIADEIVHLSLLEMNELVNKIAQHYGFHEGMLSPDNVGGDAGNDDEEGDGVEAAPAKTAFDIKLVSFDDKAKIKIIKEVRSIAGLGLKEAKEMVEGAPKIVLKQIKQEQADEIKAKLEELGAVIEIV